MIHWNGFACRARTIGEGAKPVSVLRLFTFQAGTTEVQRFGALWRFRFETKNGILHPFYTCQRPLAKIHINPQIALLPFKFSYFIF